MVKTIWMINVRPVIDGKSPKIITHVGFFDKVGNETKEEAMTRILKTDTNLRILFLATLAKIFGKATADQFYIESAKNNKRSKKTRKSNDEILIKMIGIDHFITYISSVEDSVCSADLILNEKKKNKK